MHKVSSTQHNCPVTPHYADFTSKTVFEILHLLFILHYFQLYKDDFYCFPSRKFESFKKVSSASSRRRNTFFLQLCSRCLEITFPRVCTSLGIPIVSTGVPRYCWLLLPMTCQVDQLSKTKHKGGAVLVIHIVVTVGSGDYEGLSLRRRRAERFNGCFEKLCYNTCLKKKYFSPTPPAPY